ncbi:fumarylacetoacetate hydrolase family protein [Pelagibacterium sp. H642]|uniref:2-keto-4-pentenoate hydratase n=1 Tax=Pelagibacterium sp. H642 TaxID=1881069 RepID=UPI0028166625|nr:fumarylacetoacetate hydrolase family protein [Pelagibacterium sp. H642]WMT91997.1 fumarylacetoacetate hydrolase family protein [Pelagibacterium sp. H642]
MSDPLQRHPLTQLLLDARSANTPLASVAESVLPTTLEDAYRVQAETVAALGGVGGWKVIPTPADDKPSCSPIPASVLLENGATLARGARAEVEIAVVIGKDLTEQRQYTAGDIAEALSGIHLVLEFVGSRFTDPTQMPVLATTADLQSNVAVVLGPKVQSEGFPALDKQDIALFDNGVEIQSTAGNASTDAMFDAVAWLANHARSRGLPLTAGTVVITGARLGPIAVSGPEIEAKATGFDRLTATLA